MMLRGPIRIADFRRAILMQSSMNRKWTVSDFRPKRNLMLSRRLIGRLALVIGILIIARNLFLWKFLCKVVRERCVI